MQVVQRNDRDIFGGFFLQNDDISGRSGQIWIRIVQDQAKVSGFRFAQLLLLGKFCGWSCDSLTVGNIFKNFDEIALVLVCSSDGNFTVRTGLWAAFELFLVF